MIEIVPARRVNDLRVIFFGGIVKFLKSLRQNKIVAVDEVNIFAASIFYAGIASDSKPAIFFVTNEFNFVIAAVKFLAKFKAIIGRSVIHQNNLEVAERLIQNAVDAKLYVLLDFVHRHDNRHRRIFSHTATSKNLF